MKKSLCALSLLLFSLQTRVFELQHTAYCKALYIYSSGKNICAKINVQYQTKTYIVFSDFYIALQKYDKNKLEQNENLLSYIKFF